MAYSSNWPKSSCCERVLSMIPLPPEVPERTTVQLLADRVRREPDRAAYITPDRKGGWTRTTYRDFERLTTSLAGALQKLGVQKGAPVAWMLTNDYALEAYLIYHAVHKAGAINVPLNPRLVNREIIHILNHSDSRLLIVMSSERERMEEARQACPSVRHVICVGEDGPSETLSLANLLETAPSVFTPVTMVEDDVADYFYTSGTTGLPKGVVHTHASSVATGIAVSGAFDLTPDDVYHTPFPVCAGAGTRFGGLGALYAGCTYVCDTFRVPDSLQLMQEARTTVYCAVPSIFQFMLDYPELDQYDLSSVRIWNYGGAPMAPAVIKALHEKFPRAELCQTYGLTEHGPQGIICRGELTFRKPGTVGNKGMGPYTHFKAVDEQGLDITPGGRGEFCLWGPTNMKEYLKDPEATAKVMLPGGWMRTGDSVRIDEEGCVWHIDRIKDIIIRGGFNISSVEVEEVLLEHPSVLEAAAVGKPHPRLGEEVLAVVALKHGGTATEDELLRHCETRLAHYKRPRQVVFVDRIPRNAAGKALKRELRKLFEA